MATRGTKGDTHALKVIKGAAKARRRNGEPAGSWNAAPSPPDMSPGAVVYWAHYAPKLVAAQMVNQLDRDILRDFCEMSYLCERVWDELKDAPILIDGKDGPKKSPLILAAKDATHARRMLANELGLTPTARARLNITEPVEVSELDRLLSDAWADDD